MTETTLIVRALIDDAKVQQAARAMAPLWPEKGKPQESTADADARQRRIEHFLREALRALSMERDGAHS